MVTWFLAALFLLSFAAGLRGWLFSYATSVPSCSDRKGVAVYIAPGAGFSGIRQSLIAHQVIDEDVRFVLLAKWLGVTNKMQAGEYFFSGSLSHRQILEKLVKGEVSYTSFTIPEGADLHHIASTLSDKLGFKRDDFMQSVHNPGFIKSLDLTVSSLEGYLFPDTYFVTKGQSLEEIISMMVQRFHEVFSDILSSSSEISLSQSEIVTLASIVEKETALPAERPLIAAVFLNRLKKKMKLQADPTVIYGIKDFDGNLTRKDLQTPSPYNTYTLKGLPAGPIANPGRQSLAAVLFPAQVDYLYFVAKNDGSHYFSRTLREHNRAVRKFQKR